jgi:hypothetical protein
MQHTVVSEILVPRVWGGSKISQIQKIQKILFSFKLPLSTFKRLQMLSNELSEIRAGHLAIISGGSGPQCSMIEGHLIAQHILHIGDPALSYTVLVESTKQLGLLGHVDIFAGVDLRVRHRVSGWRCRCAHSVQYIRKFLSHVFVAVENSSKSWKFKKFKKFIPPVQTPHRQARYTL